MSDLNQSRLQVYTGTGDTHRLLFPGRFIVAGRQARPTAKPFGRAELTHIRADFRNDGDCRVTVNTRNGAKKVNFPFMFFHHFTDTGIYLGNHFLEKIVMFTDDFNAGLLLTGNGEAFNGLQHLFSLLFEGAL